MAEESARVGLVSPNCADFATPNVELKRFADGESYCRLKEFSSIPGEDIVVLHRLFPLPDDQIIPLLQMMDAPRRFAAKSVRVVVPYLPYARADKVWLSGEIMSASLLMRLLRVSGASELVTWDCHFLKRTGRHTYENLPIVNLSCGMRIIEHFSKKRPDALFASPDLGASYMVGANGGKSMKKTRGEYAAGEKAFREIAKMEMEFDVKGRDVVLVDDMIAGGGTMIKAIKKCLDGGASSVRCGATHGLFLDDALSKLKDAGASEVVTSDTIPNPVAKVSIKDELEKYLK